MVIEAKSIKGSAKGLRYQADDKGLSVEISRNGLIGEDPNDWHKQMQSVEIQNKRVDNFRFSVVIAPSKEVSGSLKMEDWETLVNSYLLKMNIDKDNYQYISHLHTSTDDPHVHLTVSRIPMYDTEQNLKYKAINDNNIGVRAGSIADKIAKENGWRTAKEISSSKRKAIEDSLRIVLKSARNFKELSQAMQTHGFIVKLAENDAKGVYGMRIVPKGDVNEIQSERSLNSKQGYKLSELERHPDKKAKFRINDVKISLERNYFRSLSPQEKIEFNTSKNEKLFSSDPNTKLEFNEIQDQSFVTDSNNVTKDEKGILDHLLQSHYASSSEDDIHKKRRKKKR